MSVSHLRITQASLVSAFTFIVGQLVAFVPNLGPDKQNLISAGTTVIAAIFLVANAVHKLADSNVSASDVKAGAIDAARAEIGNVDFNGLVHDAVAAKTVPDVEALVEAKFQALLAGLARGVPVAPVPTVAPPPATGISSTPPAPSVPPAA